MITIPTSIAAQAGHGRPSARASRNRPKAFGRGLRRKAIAALAAFSIVAAPLQAAAAGLIRDAEIERTLREMITPIFHVADVTGFGQRLQELHHP